MSRGERKGTIPREALFGRTNAETKMLQLARQGATEELRAHLESDEVNNIDMRGTIKHNHRSALHEACRNFNLEKVKLLCDHGAGVSVEDNDGRKPIEMLFTSSTANITASQIEEIYDYLIERGADHPDWKDDDIAARIAYANDLYVGVLAKMQSANTASP